MRGVTSKIDDLRFRQKLAHFYRKHNMSSAAIMRAQARLLAVSLSIQTQPLGKSSSIKEKAEKFLEIEIRRVYKTAGEIGLSKNLAYAIRQAGGGSKLESTNPTQNPTQAGKAFAYLVSKGKFGQARELLKRVGISQKEITEIPIGKMDGGEAHQAARAGRFKRVPSTQTAQLIAPSARIKTYINKIKKNIGIAKAGWAACARLLGGSGTRGIPQWVTRNIGRAMGGTVIDQSDKAKGPKITIVNNVPWIDNCLREADIAEAVRIQYQKMVKAIDKAMRAEAKAVGF